MLLALIIVAVIAAAAVIGNLIQWKLVGLQRETIAAVNRLNGSYRNSLDAADRLVAVQDAQIDSQRRLIAVQEDMLGNYDAQVFLLGRITGRCKMKHRLREIADIARQEQGRLLANSV